MTRRWLAGMLGVAALMLGGLLMLPESAAAQTAGGGCQGAATPETTVEEAERIRNLYSGFFVGYVLELERVSTTRNYNGVQDLTFVQRETSINGVITQRTTALSIPPYLQEAYGGNERAIRADLEAGFLKDRGPCR
jgi:hypothetical protein